MTLFVHIADARDAAAIRRNGLKLPRWRGERGEGVFAMPVVPDFQLTHQWVRELKRRGFNTAVGIYFRIPDDTPVLIGHYNERKRPATASEAAARLQASRMLGFETLIAQSIPPRAIHAIRHLPQTLGWRYLPGAHERGIFCGCDYCQRGQYGARAIRAAWEAQYGRARSVTVGPERGPA
jgi:hypothetical protein